jgi:hypothetical protein
VLAADAAAGMPNGTTTIEYITASARWSVRSASW